MSGKFIYFKGKLEGTDYPQGHKQPEGGFSILRKEGALCFGLPKSKWYVKLGGLNLGVSQGNIPPSVAFPYFRKATNCLIKAAAEGDLMKSGRKRCLKPVTAYGMKPGPSPWRTLEPAR